jgi:predicted extracellular nuclease
VPQGLPSGDIEVIAQTSGLQTQAGVYVTIEGASPPPPPGQGIVVISQVYGGGGNQGATLTNDFVELFNRGNASIDVTGWTIQYASATGSNWVSTPLSGSLLPGQYFLVEEGTGSTGGTVALPTPDATGGISMSATSGKVALVKNNSPLSGSNPTGPSTADFVGYGSAGFAEGSPGPELSNTTAIRRVGAGCVDANNNASDFSEVSPSPRNSATPRNACP